MVYACVTCVYDARRARAAAGKSPKLSDGAGNILSVAWNVLRVMYCLERVICYLERVAWRPKHVA